MIYGQIQGCSSLRELTDLTTAHSNKSYHLGFGRKHVSRSVLSKASMIRSSHIFEDFATHMIAVAQNARIDQEFKIGGKFYAFDSSTIDLCLSVFKWANFRSAKGGIKLHTQIDIVTKIPTFVHITEAKVNDVNAMDLIQYEPRAGYVFDRGYWDLARLFKINLMDSFFIIREKARPKYEIIDGADMMEVGNVLLDQNVRFTTKRNFENYPSTIRRIAVYIPELKRTFVYYTNNIYLSASQIAFLYKNRWTVELFFKWIKQHLRVKTFWGENENAVRIQIYTAIITYCLVAIIEKRLQLGRNIYEVMRILGSALLTREYLPDLFREPKEESGREDSAMTDEPAQLNLEFDWC